jgi:hypothetical protein
MELMSCWKRLLSGTDCLRLYEPARARYPHINKREASGARRALYEPNYDLGASGIDRPSTVQGAWSSGTSDTDIMERVDINMAPL